MSGMDFVFGGGGSSSSSSVEMTDFEYLKKVIKLFDESEQESVLGETETYPAWTKRIFPVFLFNENETRQIRINDGSKFLLFVLDSFFTGGKEGLVKWEKGVPVLYFDKREIGMINNAKTRAQRPIISNIAIATFMEPKYDEQMGRSRLVVSDFLKEKDRFIPTIGLTLTSFHIPYRSWIYPQAEIFVRKDVQSEWQLINKNDYPYQENFDNKRDILFVPVTLDFELVLSRLLEYFYELKNLSKKQKMIEDSGDQKTTVYPLQNDKVFTFGQESGVIIGEIKRADVSMLKKA